MKNITFLFLSVLFVACNGKAPTEAVDLEGYELLEIGEEGLVRVIKKDETGNILEEGQMLNGSRVGSWITFHPSEPYPQKLITYADGKANGPYFEFNSRGQMEVRAFYKNNQLDGPWGKYRFGRATSQATYKDGKLDGNYFEFYSNSGKPQKQMGYKNGELHGKYYYYDEEGNITIEFTYDNGNKIE